MDKELIDKAWACLPREFREEVKRLAQYYSRHVSALFGMERQRADKFYREFVSLFGIHNLTSDAEGEEMLTVSRKEIQQLVAANDKLIKKHPGRDSIEAVQAKTVSTILNRLFGSKCLPDEEPKPAEPKFKVGDRVRVKGYGYEPNLHKGDIGEILGINDNEQCFVLFKKSQAWIYADCLEPYTEPVGTKDDTTNAKRQAENILTKDPACWSAIATHAPTTNLKIDRQIKR